MERPIWRLTPLFGKEEVRQEQSRIGISQNSHNVLGLDLSIYGKYRRSLLVFIGFSRLTPYRKRWLFRLRKANQSLWSQGVRHSDQSATQARGVLSVQFPRVARGTS